MKLRLTIILITAILAATGIAHAQPLELWLYNPTNLLVDKNITDNEALWKRAAAAGYTHILLADTKLAKLGDLEGNTAHYMANLQRTKEIAARLHLQLVPAVFSIGYSSSMLWHDPNLAEGLPVKDQPFVVKNGEARPADSPVSFPARPAFKDDTVRMDNGVATVAPIQGNGRFNFQMKLPRFRAYRVTVKVKTRNFRGDARIAPIADGVTLNYQDLGAAGTQDWKTSTAVFNTLDHSDVTVYFGIWGGSKGTLQWKDWKIEEVGLLNVLRREGAPCIVKDAAGKVLTEGTDYQRIADPHLGNTPWKGEYDNTHEPPVISTHLPDGTKLSVSYYHPAIIYEGQVAICFADPRTLKLMADEAARVRKAFGAPGYMMSYDEIRVCGWDESCAKTGQTPGQMLADNVRAATKMLEGSTAYVWSDMFDPFHNAHDNYYLVKGTWAGSWEGLDKNVVIVNWNYDKRDESLKFFADRGNRQLIAGYYDGAWEEPTRQWLQSARKVKGVVGMMYTTWQHNYDNIEAFAKLCRE